MAINLKSLVSPTRRPAFVTLVGDGGMGKTTLASMFPSPVFIRTEDGTQAIAHREDVALFPVAKSSAEVFEAIETLKTENHPFKTLVIDSISKLSAMFEAETIAADGKAKSLNQAGGGYGAGYQIVASAHRKIREACGDLQLTKNMNIVFIAHADRETVELPDQDSFSRYTIRMNPKFLAPYTDDVDLVAFLKLRTYVATKEGEKSRASTDGSRIITCYPTPSHISKNRFGITQDLVFTTDAFPFAGIL